MSLDKKEVQKMAELARLKITDEEVDHYSEELSDVLDYVNKLNEVDVEDVPPTKHATGVVSELREDEPRGTVESRGYMSKTLMKLVPRTEEGFAKVKAILKNKKDS